MKNACRIRSVMLVPILYLIFTLSGFAGEIMEEFVSPRLTPELWVVKTVGKASFEIGNSQLTMKSPAVEDGVLLQYVPNINGEDITFEFKFDISQGEPSAQIWFADEPLTPDVNTTVNLRWIMVQTIVNGAAYVKIAGDQKVIQDTPVLNGSNVYKMVLKGNKASFFVNGNEMGNIDKPANVNYFHIGPDMYTSHYGNRVGILEYINISGPNVHPLAVTGHVDGLAVTWGGIKRLN